MNSTTSQSDFLIIGSGAAGLHAALHASRFGRVSLVTKSSLEASSSYWAQGGIAAVLNNHDSFQSHKKDTVEAGRGLCNTEAVDLLVREGAERVQELVDLGMPFDRTNGTLDLGLEGGHSNRRVLHANGAATGKALVEFLTKRVERQSNIEIIEHAFVYRLQVSEGRCKGISAYLYRDDTLLNIRSTVTILATGGYSGLYRRTTNPHTSTGDGLWLGYNAGARLKDLEFVQFHPTAFYAEDGSTFLISEAVRGEGARLYNERGERFMKAYPREELAPRDVVSQEIFRQIKQQEQNYVYLDVRHLDVVNLTAHFPALFRKIKEQGIDVSSDGIPVAPAAHYCIGGIATDLDARTSVKGLYACGEVAATEVHGANRLASNSLLECLVFSKRAVENAVNTEMRPGAIEERQLNLEIDDRLESEFLALRRQVSDLLSRYVGIYRSEKGLQVALNKFRELAESFTEHTNEYFAIRTGGLLKIAELITKAALERKESRGVHTRSDYPEAGSELRHFSYENHSQPAMTG
ncbi:MAG: L-aspartate oxidase [Balneolaceae bacterium]